MLCLQYVYGAIKSELEHYGEIKVDVFYVLSTAELGVIPVPQGPLASINYFLQVREEEREVE